MKGTAGGIRAVRSGPGRRVSDPGQSVARLTLLLVVLLG
jgi:hypothetical protein